MEKLTQMQVDEILSEADAQRVTQPYLRRGQAFFNIMYERYPELADSIRATEYDPFHVDDKL
ncbi:MAG: hypothetical protein KAH32_08185, partial [Chlamydiia bacterium]|nr:hypothetical protein [Chlamydiia bacterium]